MKWKFIIFILFSLDIYHAKHHKFTVAVHGGAGSYNRTKITLEREIEIKKGILESLNAGFQILKNGGCHLEAVREAIVILEDNPLFNAGKGAKINQKYEVELDASIVDGSNLKCGAVAGVKRIKNPIKSAELVMKSTPHILLVSDAADEYAREKGEVIVDNKYFFTDERIQEWIDAHDKRKANGRMGTVGAVAMDSQHRLSAATSTGGITYKMAGRVGDSPIIGAGNYANDKTCAISATGDGEEMIRRSFGFNLHAKMLYKGYSLSESANELLAELPDETGGFIAVDAKGNVEMPYNTSGMARGYVREDGVAYIYIFNEGDDLTPTVYNLNSLVNL